MCIWEVDESARLCEFCSYRGGCESYEKVTPVDEAGSLYANILSEIIGRNILERCRERSVVWARNILCYRLYLDGYSLHQIGKFVGVNHTTVLYGRNQVSNMLEMPSMYPDEIKLWERFTELLSLQKN